MSMFKDMKMQKTKPFAPVGMYDTYFLGVKAEETKFETCLEWTFEIVRGKYKGLYITARTYNKIPSLTNAFGKMLNDLNGQEFEDDDDIDETKFIGQPYAVSVVEKDGFAKFDRAFKQ